MRGYVRHFFGCRPCAEHFEEMAKENLSVQNTPSAAVLWLWTRHNQVNNRLAGRSQPVVRWLVEGKFSAQNPETVKGGVDSLKYLVHIVKLSEG